MIKDRYMEQFKESQKAINYRTELKQMTQNAGQRKKDIQ